MDDDRSWRELIDELTPEQIAQAEQIERERPGDPGVERTLFETAQKLATSTGRDRFVNQHPYAATYARYCWDEGERLRRYRDSPQLPEKAQELVIQLIDEAFSHDVADEHVTEILERLYGENLDVDIPACWELHRQQQQEKDRKEIQERYVVKFGSPQSISGHTGPPPAIWGAGFEVLWSPGEPLMIEAGYGAGKTTLAGLLVRAQLFGGDVLGYPVQKLPEGQKILYLAIDRPDQIDRSMSRQFSRAQLAEIAERQRLIVVKGALPADAAENNDLYVDMCDYYQTHYVYVDSLKDAARGLTEDRAAAAYQATRTRLLASRRQLVELHHLAKSGSDYGSVWLRAGAGSVLRMSGKPGGPTGVLTHEKQPAHRVESVKIAHDRDCGEIGVAEAEAPVELGDWIADQDDGVTATEAAQLLFGAVGKNDVERARRTLAKLVEDGQLREVAGGRGRNNPTRWFDA